MARGLENLMKKLEDRPEPSWGQRMAVYRDRVGLTMKEVAQIIDEFTSVSPQSIYRLELRDTAPTDKRQRRIATLALMIYGVRPKGMGLDEAELPSALNLAELDKAHDAVHKARRGGTSSRWTQQDPLRAGLSSSAA